jgi:hypothetical protein
MHDTLRKVAVAFQFVGHVAQGADTAAQRQKNKVAVAAQRRIAAKDVNECVWSSANNGCAEQRFCDILVALDFKRRLVVANKAELFRNCNERLAVSQVSLIERFKIRQVPQVAAA